MKKTVFTLILLAFYLSASSQESINNYKYLVIPIEFHFTDGKDKWRLNTLTRYLFKQEGFNVFFEEEDKPKELEKSNCIALFADVKKLKGGFFKTKLQIILKDCLGKVVYSSKIGESRQKNFKLAYSEAIKNAFKSIKRLNYKYTPKVEEVITKTEAPTQTVTKTEITTKPVESNKEKEDDEWDYEIVEDKKPVKTDTEKDEIETLYVFERENVFELRNSNQVVYVVKKTTKKDLFILVNFKGVLYKDSNNWVVEYYDYNSKELIVKKVQVKF